MKNLQQVFVDSFSEMCAHMWLDGLDGQEDELQDIQKGRLNPSAGDQGGVFIRPDQGAIAQEKADEDDEEIQADLETRTPG